MAAATKTGAMSPAKSKGKFRPFWPPPPVSDGPAAPVLPAAAVDTLVAKEPPKDEKQPDFGQLWELMAQYIPATVGDVQRSFVQHLEFTCARSRFSFDPFSTYVAVSRSVRDRLIELFNDTQEWFVNQRLKHIYYVSIEFLMGRFLRNALLNMELEDLYREALGQLGVDLDAVYEEEVDPGLGNGGLGRLAACFLDSMATLNLPAWGYGLLYQYGMFKQAIDPGDGSQTELPDVWLANGDPWRVRKETVRHPVRFFGYVHDGTWHPALTVMAVANDFLIPGFCTDNTIGLRLWESVPSDEVNEGKFRAGDYYAAIEDTQRWSNLTSVLYPNDNTDEGKEMRLMQEYFLSSATLRDIIRRLKTHQRQTDIRSLPEFAAIQLNDTHPAVMVIELLRILIDEEKVPFDEARAICQKVFSYTCHTLMPEALEQWSVPLFERVLPRHIQLVYQLNQWWIDHLLGDVHASDDVVRDLSLIGEGGRKTVRMANIAVVGSHTVNGVAKIHSQLMQQYVFKNFAALGEKTFTNKTNGVTVRRWLHHCNRGLTQLINEVTASDKTWSLTGDLTNIVTHVSSPGFLQKWGQVKLDNKRRLAAWVKANLGLVLDPEKQLFDVQVKRIHEYKRQALNVFGIIWRYLQIKDGNTKGMQARAVMIGGKAAPGYFFAKRLIKLISNVARTVNADPDAQDLLKVLYIPNYNVSLAELIIPGSDTNKQISTAGTEASGTSNMKFAYNSSVVIGTWDGANIEIGDACGAENLFFFGVKAHQVDALRAEQRPIGDKLKRVLDTIKAGVFGPSQDYECIWRSVEGGDHYLVNVDFEDYLLAEAAVDQAYQDKTAWLTRTVAITANMGVFNSDRTIDEYAREIWHIKPAPALAYDEHGHPLHNAPPVGSKVYTTGVGSRAQRKAWVAVERRDAALEAGRPVKMLPAARSLPHPKGETKQKETVVTTKPTKDEPF